VTGLEIEGNAVKSIALLMLSVSALGCGSAKAADNYDTVSVSESTDSARHEPQAEADPASSMNASCVLTGDAVLALEAVLKKRASERDLTPAERRLANFQVRADRVDGEYLVAVWPMPDPGGSVGGGNVYGKGYLYHVRRSGERYKVAARIKTK
jgi:hypothetical protein